jgi:hypothetical protein
VSVGGTTSGQPSESSNPLIVSGSVGQESEESGIPSPSVSEDCAKMLFGDKRISSIKPNKIV